MEKELRANARKEIAKQLDVSEGHVSNVKKAYKANGIAGIKPRHQGRKTGEKRILSPQQEKEIMRIIVDKDPMQLRLMYKLMYEKTN
ncbi:MAG: helix-turn-helix domain-containing protein [Ruminococcus sp.]|nr:helix-turn-helix domain-containing protein [Ruminococcus sp.]